MMSLKLIRVLFFYFAVAFAARQTEEGQAVLDDGRASRTQPIQKLSLLSSTTHYTISHPVFPNHSARIKKSDFCDGTVNSYTGYIDVGPRHHFFYFFESRNKPEEDDVVLWTNGGPGASSAYGLFMELGPCNIVNETSTEFNPYSWNNNANIFFIDQPIGVGFSYHDYGEFPVTTEEASVDIVAFMAAFFETFKEFKGLGLHLTGESYAGRYLPIYGSAILDYNPILISNGYEPINLKSLAIGNGATNFGYLYQSYYDVLCTNASVEPLQSISNCVRMKQILPRCDRAWTENCIKHFDLIDCNAALAFCSEELMMSYLNLGYSFHDMTTKCNNIDPCIANEAFIEPYLNTPSVRAILGIDPAFPKYNLSSMPVGLAFNLAGDLGHATDLYVAELLARDVKVLIYAGTIDFICNWVANERWMLDLEWSGKEHFGKEELREWVVNGKVAGKTRGFGGFTFATVYGAGHMVPFYKPEESLEMINRWISGVPL